MPNWPDAASRELRCALRLAFGPLWKRIPLHRRNRQALSEGIEMGDKRRLRGRFSDDSERDFWILLMNVLNRPRCRLEIAPYFNRPWISEI